MQTKLLIAAGSLALLAGCGHGDGGEEVTQVAEAAATEAGGFTDIELILPDDYKNTGPYMISDRLGQEDQVIVLYANATARLGARTDGVLPNDSVIVGEVYGAKMDADGQVVESQVGRRIPDELKAIVMMQRRASWDDQYPEALKVGGWEFEVFSPAGENLNKDTTACRECHHPLTDSEFTFSYDHLAAAN